jgi:stage II sporulation protein D
MGIKTRYFSRRLFLLLALAAPFFLLGASALDETRYQRVSDQIRAGQYLEAAETYKAILGSTEDPELRAKVQELLGDLYAIYLELPDLAAEQYELVLTRYPDSPWVDDALFNVGMIHFEKGDWEAAKQKFRQVLNEYPDSPRAFTAETLIEQAEIYQRDPSRAPAPEAVPEPSQVAAQEIRVLVVDFSAQATIKASSAITIREDPLSDASVTVGNTAQIVAASGNFLLNGKPISGGSTVLTLSCPDQSLSIGDRSFRGVLLIQPQSTGFIVVNRLPLEDYLRGVVPKEMPAVWPLEALKAQAVAARTYALYQIEKHQDEQWDVMATVMSQVYGGRQGETPSTDQAVRETAGQILTYNQRPILAYFHSNSGGHTENTASVWGTDLPYLEAVNDPYSKGTRVDSWQATYTLDQINQALASDGIVGVTDIQPDQYSPSGRVTRIRFQTVTGSMDMPANTARLRLGSTVMKSTWWTEIKQGNRFVFQGQGYGHGVGMSQWGAKSMADIGSTYQEILAYYYPKCSVTDGSR